MATRTLTSNNTRQNDVDMFPREIRHNHDIDPFDTLDNPSNSKQKLETSRVSKYEPNLKQCGSDGKKIPVNSLCLCGSGKKFKKCCINRDSTNGRFNTKCRFCNQVIHTICFEDYLNHVEDDRIQLIKSIENVHSTDITAKKESWVNSDKKIKGINDLKFDYDPSPELKREINKRIFLLNELELYLGEQRKTYPGPEL